MFRTLFPYPVRKLAFAGVLLLAAATRTPAQTPEIERLRQAASEGRTTTDDLNDLGTRLQMHYLADGLDIDEVGDHPGLIEARSYFQQASEMGDVEARNNLSAMVRLGQGGPQDEAEADRLLYAAAAAGSVGANMTLSAWYRDGVPGIAQDEARALAHMRAAAETGHAFAQWRYAMMIREGIGSVSDPEEAYRWVVMASDQDDTHAMVSRGVMLATGEGVVEDDVAAREWYGRAAESGEVAFEDGLRGLGFMLFTGEGGPADRPRGFAYLMVAAAAGSEDAETLMQRFELQLSDEEREQASRLASEWADEHLDDDSDAE